MIPIHIQFTRFSAFYSPLISTMSGGFLAAEGLEASHSIAPAGKSAIDALVAGTAQVAQSALSQGLTSLEKGEQPAAVHFAQINEKDGFFLTAREPDPDFRWDKLPTWRSRPRHTRSHSTFSPTWAACPSAIPMKRSARRRPWTIDRALCQRGVESLFAHGTIWTPLLIGNTVPGPKPDA